MAMRRLALATALLGLVGCWRPLCSNFDFYERDNRLLVDPQPASAEAALGATGKAALQPPRDGILAATVQQPQKPATQPPAQPPTLIERLKLPADVPGAQIPDIRLPPPGSPRQEIEAAIAKYFPPLPTLPDEPRTAPSPTGGPLTLSDLQRLAMTNSPVLRQAAADVQAAQGAAVQAGLYPNPTVGFTGQSAAPGGGPFAGAIFQQTIKTPGKLRLAQTVALSDVRIAELKLRQTEADLWTQVRSGYFAVLVARENLKVSRAMAQLTDEIFKVLVLQLKVGEVATYEPMAVRVLAMQARGQVIQAHNRYVSAWKQLAAILGLPGMPLTDLAGGASLPIPGYPYDKVLAYVLSNHTDVLTAENNAEKAQQALRLARITPIPDVTVSVNVFRDFSPPGPTKTATALQIGAPVPLFDRNQGNIYQAQGVLVHALEDAHKARDDLTARLADAFERYQNNRALIDMYSKQIIPNQVQAFRSVVIRHARAGAEKGGVSYNDLVTAEQTLVNVITNYLNVLRDQWTAVVDVAGLLQMPDLFQLSEASLELHALDLESLLRLCCEHPCSPLQDPRLYGGDGYWPAAYRDVLPPVAPASR